MFEKKLVVFAYQCDACLTILECPCFVDGKCPECSCTSKTSLYTLYTKYTKNKILYINEIDCVKCDRFVSSIDENGFCTQCASEEKEWPMLEADDRVFYFDETNPNKNCGDYLVEVQK